MNIIFSGASASGKTSIVNKIIRQNTNTEYILTCTTRTSREGETNNVDYKFLTKEEFEERIAKAEFLEYANFNNNYYGCQKTQLENKEGFNKVGIFDIEGIKSFKKLIEQKKLKREDFIFVFVNVNKEEIIQRLFKRSEEQLTNKISQEENSVRLKRYEKDVNFMKESKFYDIVVENNKEGIEECYENLLLKLEEKFGLKLK